MEFHKVLYPTGLNIRTLKNIFLEAFEIAFILCNIGHHNYSVAKILDIVEQIMPTAYAYGTAYWIFFRKNQRRCLCICAAFSLNCPHNREGNIHHINMSPVADYGCKHVINRSSSNIGIPVNFSVEIITNSTINTMDALINFMLENSCYEGLNKISLGLSQMYSITLRYCLIYETFASDTNHAFVQHPSAHEYYGSIFPILAQKYIYQSPEGQFKFIPGIYLPAQMAHPKYSVLAAGQRIEMNSSPINYSTVVNFLDTGTYTAHRYTTDQGTQTDEVVKKEAEQPQQNSECFYNGMNSGFALAIRRPLPWKKEPVEAKKEVGSGVGAAAPGFFKGDGGGSISDHERDCFNLE